jgi:metal-responsive CopG/Arc/MetJ family transcriptional regulator
MNSKDKLSVTVSPDLIKWLDEMTEDSTFAGRSHGVELCLRRCKERFEKERREP